MIISNREYITASLSSDGFVAVNKRVLRAFDGDGTLAIVLCELISIYNYQREGGRLDALDAFPLPIVMMEKNLAMSSYKQQRALAELSAAGLCTTMIIGMPGRRWVTLNFDAIASFLQLEKEKEVVKEESSELFYSTLSLAASCVGEKARRTAIRLASGNMQETLWHCIQLTADLYAVTTNHRPQEWTPRCIGTLKNIISDLRKERDRFDYGRFQDVLSWIAMEQGIFGSVENILISAQKICKTVPERSPHKRIYEIGEEYEIKG